MTTTDGNEETERRAEFIRSLRACADFLEQHPGVQAPIYVRLTAFIKTRAELSEHARIATWEKEYLEEYFQLKKAFGEDLSLEITAPRETICRRIVTGQRVEPTRTVDIVRWECEDKALLAEVER